MVVPFDESFEIAFHLDHRSYEFLEALLLVGFGFTTGQVSLLLQRLEAPDDLVRATEHVCQIERIDLRIVEKEIDQSSNRTRVRQFVDDFTDIHAA